MLFATSFCRTWFVLRKFASSSVRNCSGITAMQKNRYSIIIQDSLFSYKMFFFLNYLLRFPKAFFAIPMRLRITWQLLRLLLSAYKVFQFSDLIEFVVFNLKDAYWDAAFVENNTCFIRLKGNIDLQEIIWNCNWTNMQ